MNDGLYTVKKKLNFCLLNLKEGKNVVLSVVLQTEGSTPGKTGAIMCGLENGSIFGTIGGGCIELFVREKIKECFEGKKSYVLNFNLNGDVSTSQNAYNLPMICGGSVKVLLQYISVGDKNAIDVINTWYKALNENNNSLTFIVYKTDEAGNLTSFKTSNKYISELNTFCYLVFPPYNVWLIGAGHVSKALCRVLSYVGFDVCVYDEREDLATSENFPNAKKIIVSPIADFNKKVKLNKNDAVVIMTPGHIKDFEALEQVVNSSAFYIGVIGSKNKVELTKQKLKGLNIRENIINKIKMPIGFPIGAVTPEEISISICSQLIAVRAALVAPDNSKIGKDLIKYI